METKARRERRDGGEEGKWIGEEEVGRRSGGGERACEGGRGDVEGRQRWRWEGRSRVSGSGLVVQVEVTCPP